MVAPSGDFPTKNTFSVQKLRSPIHFKNIYKKVIAKRRRPSQSLLFLKIAGVAADLLNTLLCRFGFSTLAASKRSKFKFFNIVTALGNTYESKLWQGVGYM